ncbi:MAG TPA: PstS family phosphate ABC transporter substrate-binding protein [Burkholderiales bacterium]|jgi:phosphate transport system substrate-binding protein|nr:PstS family phosphate ABC transporter substrate-binding protein [Burkholderiales bacterium]
MSKSYRVLVSAAALTLAGALGAVAPAAHSQTVKIDGSSTVFPISEAVAEDFQRAKKGKVKVTVGISGTGGGFKKFCRGETDVSNASRPILRKEMEECRKNGVEYIELPVAYDALTVVIHPKNTWAETMTVAELKKMWEPAAQGRIKTWKQVNPNWPDRPLALYGAGADSGTFDYFTEAINGKSKASRGDFTASEDDNVLVQGVSRDENAIGYFGFAYFSENSDKLKAVRIAEKAGAKAVAPSIESVLDGSYQPLSRPIFIYVNAKSAQRPEIREFVEFYMKNADNLVREVKYVPLPPKAYAYNLDHFSRNIVGTKYGGENKVGLTIEQLMTMEAKL